MEYVWIVTYWDEGQEPVVIPFNNEDAARECFACFVMNHCACMDKSRVYSKVSYTE